MYELIQLSEHDHYIDCPSRMGLVVTNPGEVAVIDSGNNKDAGKRIIKAADANGWKVQAVYATHAHADHIGGNALLHARTGCTIYARGVECDFSNHTILNPSLCYGAFPPLATRKDRFFSAESCETLPVTEDVLPEGFRMIPLPGHSLDMTGYMTPDGNFYIGDAVCSVETIEKYKIGFLVDVAKYLTSLEFLKTIPAAHYIASHAPAVEDITELADRNIRGVYEVAENILEICKEPHIADEILRKIMYLYGTEMSLFQYELIGSTVRSYLSWLEELGKVEIVIEDNYLKWHTVEG